MNITKESIIGDVVANNYLSAGVFEQAGIDFCCNGNRAIESACTAEDLPEILKSLQQISSSKEQGSATAVDYKSWPLDLLADYIEKKHHRYVKAQIPIIQAFLDKINTVHGTKHPELAEIKSLFDESAAEFTAHMKKEEKILFPLIREMETAKQEHNKTMASPFGTVQNPIKMMMHEHDTEGERFRAIKKLSNAYQTPSDGCNTYRAAFANLEAFENDLHLHIHLENNILFPKSIELEESLRN